MEKRSVVEERSSAARREEGRRRRGERASSAGPNKEETRGAVKASDGETTRRDERRVGRVRSAVSMKVKSESREGEMGVGKV